MRKTLWGAGGSVATGHDRRVHNADHDQVEDETKVVEKNCSNFTESFELSARVQDILRRIKKKEDCSIR